MHTMINDVFQFSSNRKRRRSSKSPIEPWSGDNLGALNPSVTGREPGDPVVQAAEGFVRWSNRGPGRTYGGGKTIDTSTPSAKRLRMTR